MSTPLLWTVPDPNTGDRLDRFLAAAQTDLSRSQLQTLIRDGRVLVNGRPARVSHRLQGGDAIAVDLPEPAASEGLDPEDVTLEIVFEDEHLLVVNKPAGMVVHPGAGVDDEPGGFGDHDQVRVLVDHIERPFLGLEPCGRRERNFDLNEVAGLQSQGGARPATVDGGAAFANQPLETATRQVRLRRGQEAIQPLPRSGLRHRPAQYPHAWVASGAR